MNKYEELAKLADNVMWAADEPWVAEGVEVYGDGCDSHPIATCGTSASCRLPHEQEALAKYIAAAGPDVVSEMYIDMLRVDTDRIAMLTLLSVAGSALEDAAEQLQDVGCDDMGTHETRTMAKHIREVISKAEWDEG